MPMPNSFPECETSLEADLERLNGYFRCWRLQPNPAKTETCVFHLSLHDANRMLNTNFADPRRIQHVDHPKYLYGVTLDRSLIYKTHLMKTEQKVAARVNTVRKLADTNWGPSADTSRTASLTLSLFTCRILRSSMVE
jgi:hypothetical protein